MFDDYFGRQEATGEWQDLAQFCVNGHFINAAVKASPEFNKRHCDKCGAETITECPKCKGIIKGELHVPGIVVGGYTFPAPSFCEHCGAAFPWTEARLEAAKELAGEMEGLTPEERELMKQSLDQIVRDTPQTTLAATRFKKLATKAGKGAAAAIWELVKDLASEAAKKALFPTP